jgi:hypothetical protein
VASAVGTSSAVAGKTGLVLAAKLSFATLLAGSAVATAVVATRTDSARLAPTVTMTSTALVASSVDDAHRTMILAPPRAEAAAVPEPSNGQREPLPVSTVDAHAPTKPADVDASTGAPSTQATSPEARAAALKTESEGVQRARAQLTQGNPGGALATLAELDRDVPRGALGQERALYAILALSAAGQHERASRQADAFLRTWPSSPHAARVRELADR